MNHLLSGTGVALVTPMDVEGGVDYQALGRLIEHNITHGVNYLVVLGTTAESVTLNPEEKSLIASFVRQQVAGRIPLVLGHGGNDTAALVAGFEQMDLTGYSALLSVTPYYNRPSQKGLEAHYLALAAASPLPILLYNVPSRTGCNLENETIWALLAQSSKFIGVKEASADFDKTLDLLAQRPEGFLVISGDDGTASEAILAGADGVISVIGQALTAPFVALIHASSSGDRQKTQTLMGDLSDLIDLIFEEGNPTGIKALLSILGICRSNVRLPLIPASTGLESKLRLSLLKRENFV
ncbi:MAG: 4-hydroxy-tetrahydrodipicolinate synthase [Flavobacteriaceae bacterium]|nr:4-hydroxy-tetrahydrodipicolinate synthase [Flavobacteriaceae bacterium]MDP4674517.1 4-hydroxy-tetrahydrodipicolinate synthase [Flavobacteriaceae bacterium]MDP4754417.1 4-hydroxy-tetrahydrodipicolinate synthase [Flavobacteriaceae bacterium]MDP4794372.1 4-hydroxy-tetrahydrodipicolinate synthase [Flavobacteriaceae bacterium]MDP4886008.1 4-hydroxy-tetrahydrodipicolinate synthase [Flavobacteriaceae bacterium]